jgi:hypothetical protein
MDNIPDNVENKNLYKQARETVYARYKKPSGFRSGALVKEYLRLGGTYSGKEPDDGIKRWFEEDWQDVGNEEYPVFRPTIKISKDTPLTVEEIDPKDLKEKIKEKQIIKGKRNLSPFKEKKGSMLGKTQPDPELRGSSLGGQKLNIKIQVSKKYPEKKYDAIINDGEKIIDVVSFGDPNFQDFTMHKDEERKKLYIGRRSDMEKKYYKDPFAPAFYSQNLLWNRPSIQESIKDIMDKFPNLNIYV